MPRSMQADDDPLQVEVQPLSDSCHPLLSRPMRIKTREHVLPDMPRDAGVMTRLLADGEGDKLFKVLLHQVIQVQGAHSRDTPRPPHTVIFNIFNL